MMTLAQAHEHLPGSLLVGDGTLRLQRVHADTRTLQPGDLFVALKGERFDGHDHLVQAQQAGARAALASRGLQSLGLSGLIVPDTRQALGRLAAHWRKTFSVPLIAVTGSNGKTTVTQMIASILTVWQGSRALSTRGNFNNEIGVPLTLLRLRHASSEDQTEAHQVAVVELGMNHPGEIGMLSQWVAPTVALVNNAQREHQEFMVSVRAVALENGAVLQALPASGIAVFPSDDEFTPLWRTLAAERRVMTFALDKEADVRVLHSQWAQGHWTARILTPHGEADLTVAVAGRHHLKNALAALTCALAAGCPLPIALQGLVAFTPVAGRMQVHTLTRSGQPWTLIDDTYNANPDSVRAAIEVLASLPSSRWLILGDMGEVGHQGPQFHAEIGAYAKQQGIEQLWGLGELSRHAVHAFSPPWASAAQGRHFATMAELLAALPGAWAEANGISVVVKGSRFMKMEQAVAALTALAAPHPGAGAC
jgi:UDP-N-acetylmuramoyl-tripeptide--D-alanyl-D-alanine ligase